jgi:dTDP-4-dehydrorhamnose 3,5-epimerase-like enzyme
VLFFEKYDIYFLLEGVMTLKYERLRLVSDARGSVFEPIDPDGIEGHRNAHVVISGPGVTRGNHYHERGRETMAVMGHALVRIKDDSGIADIEVPHGEVYQFVYNPGVSHAIRNMSDHPNVLMAFNTVEHDPSDPDTVTDIIL